MVYDFINGSVPGESGMSNQLAELPTPTPAQCISRRSLRCLLMPSLPQDSNPWHNRNVGIATLVPSSSIAFSGVLQALT